MTLLSKTRRLNKLLQKAAGTSVNFMEMGEVLRDIIDANVFVVSRKGKILGCGLARRPQNAELAKYVLEELRFPPEANQWFASIDETTGSEDVGSPYRNLVEQVHTLLEDRYVTVVPILGAGDRIGTLLITRAESPFGDDDLVLAEYGSTIVGMEILRERAEESEQEARTKTAVQVAVGSLSFSELEAVEHIFEELNGKEGLLVASKVADRVGITRSVIVNALRKLESAGVIETRSLGMKGTYIKILNDQLVEQILKPGISRESSL
ncbi:GTP-sensing pleiotropic transcriptional regulator CodY [Paenibacillus sp.]|uniref:GTP-sensing pleiotropic transcriptional regulator CodY n=1 Tax=Paenibacillus sp. TaxID=58172 RepID=UPI002D6C3C54|nr:GTP-sensing pleiotropic transcriptional regulator CodY [Paenibacillus sp.]HZG57897.1 GTP-sensing pleiotropic transcriptional regulator CodY [Paenibacillus sp.]